MTTQTSSGLGRVVGICVVLIVVIMGISFMSRQVRDEDDDQAFVDFEATWSPDRAMIVIIEIGGEPELTLTVQRDEPPRLGVRRPAFRGQTVRMIVTPVHDRDPGTISCSITVNETIIDEDQADGTDECFVEGVVS